MQQLLTSFINRENVDKFTTFYDFFIKSAKSFNLTSLTDESDVYVKHFIDSLYGKSFLTENAKVVEIGSGGGFPSVPLKIERPDLDFTLIEATGKKCNYLNDVKKLLNFDKFTVENGRCEDLGNKPCFRESFDFAVARAVAPLNILIEYLVPFLKVGGRAICYKGSNFKEEVELATNAIKTMDCKIVEEFLYELPLNYGKRAIIVIEKTKKTNPLYPRNQSKIKKAPL